MSEQSDQPSIDPPAPEGSPHPWTTGPGATASEDLLAALADDFAARARRGERPTVEEYVAKHPTLAESIRKIFPAIAVIEETRSADFASLGEGPGSTIGRYKLLERIGEGGFGVIYMAEQQHPVRRRVALKVLKPGMDSRQVLARFEAERQALAIMDHPNIAKVFDGGLTDSGRPYFVMELVKGVPITDFCDQQQLIPRQRLELFAHVCHAVQHAHQKGIIHRDIKPTNVLVIMHDATPVVKVIDFGVAKALGQELTDKTLFTGFAQLVGTPLYMSPEQAGQSAIDVDTRSDIYSLGVLLYELLTGTTPFDKERFKQAAQDEIRRIIREEEPPTPSTRLLQSRNSLASISAQRQMEPAKLTRLVCGELDWIVMKALEKDRNRRYETANGLAMDVQRYLDNEPVQAFPPSALYRLRKYARRNKARLAVGALMLAFLVLLGSGIGWEVRDRAARQARIAAQVELILSEADRLQREQKWPEALSTVRRAEAAVTGGGADAATTQRVGEQLKDLEFVDRLEQIRMRRAIWLEGKFDNAGADREYERAFREHGADIFALPIDRTIGLLKARPALAIRVAAALDHWVFTRWVVDHDADSAKRLVAVARGIDPEPLRDRLRTTIGRPASEVGDELRQLARSTDIRAHHPATLDTLVTALYRADPSDFALRFARDAQAAYPADFWLNFNLAYYLAEQKDYEGATRFYTAAVAIRPNAVAALNNLGNALHSQEQLDEAVSLFRKAIEINPRFEIGYNNLGNVLGNQGNVGEAAAAYGKTLEFSPTDAAAYNNLGAALSKMKKPQEAIVAYRRAIELNPNDADFQINLGAVLCDDLKEYDKAIECFNKAIELEPKNYRAYICLAVASRKLKPEDAIAALEKAIEIDPRNSLAYRRLGAILQEQKKLGEAIAAYTRAIERNSQDAELYGVRASAHASLGQWDSAAADYEKELRLNPNDHWPWYFRGCMLAYLDRRQQYVEHCRAMLVQFASTQDAGIIERTTKTALLLPNAVPGDVDQVAGRVERATALMPDSPWIMLLKGMAECRAGRFQDAVDSLQKCRAVPPEDYFAQVGAVTADAFLAIASHQLGQIDQARSALNRADSQAARVFPQVGSSAFASVNVDHWLVAQTALREAEDLISGRQPTTAPKP